MNELLGGIMGIDLQGTIFSGLAATAVSTIAQKILPNSIPGKEIIGGLLGLGAGILVSKLTGDKESSLPEIVAAGAGGFLGDDVIEKLLAGVFRQGQLPPAPVPVQQT